LVLGSAHLLRSLTQLQPLWILRGGTAGPSTRQSISLAMAAAATGTCCRTV